MERKLSRPRLLATLLMAAMTAVIACSNQNESGNTVNVANSAMKSREDAGNTVAVTGSATISMEAAQKSITDIATVLASTPARAARVLPEQLADVQRQFNGLRSSFASEDYGSVVRNAPWVMGEAQRLADAAGQFADDPEDRATLGDMEKVALRDIGNGLIFPVGESLRHFQARYADVNCFDFPPNVDCEIRTPSGSDCPSTQPCDSVVYAFQDGHMVGFVAQYREDAWTQLLASTKKSFGLQKRHRTSHVGSMVVDLTEWILKGGDDVGFAHYSGADYYGNPVAKPFSVYYNVKSDAK